MLEVSEGDSSQTSAIFVIFAIFAMDGRKLGPRDVLGRTHYPFSRLTGRCCAVAIPGSDATNQDALDGAVV